MKIDRIHSDIICGILQARVFPTMEIYDSDIRYIGPTHMLSFTQLPTVNNVQWTMKLCEISVFVMFSRDSLPW